ncbi:MAG: hemerythrin family protein [Fibromonadaceae bacterium]|jgi:hemerythrin|nr:hemerythrin family protein [Fibromonadaceae bacterium]
MEKSMLEHNVFIVWSPEYNLGIPIIDEQHRGIVSTINSLHFGMQNNYGKNILSPIIEMMHDYTRIHFQIEESFLEKIDFPNAKKHHELHRDLSYKLTSAGRSSLLDKDPYKFMDFLKSWWINHICNEDFIYRNYTLS